MEYLTSGFFVLCRQVSISQPICLSTCHTTDVRAILQARYDPTTALNLENQVDFKLGFKVLSPGDKKKIFFHHRQCIRRSLDINYRMSFISLFVGFVK